MNNETLLYLNTALIAFAGLAKALKAYIVARTIKNARVHMRAAIKGLNDGTGTVGSSAGSGVDPGSVSSGGSSSGGSH